MSWDVAANREANAGPGADTRMWVSNGTVNADQPAAPAVDFTQKAGPLVSVRLHPSDNDVRCRVASFIAGAGETEWHPFAPGDEVLVVFPLGSERGGAIIIARLNNGVDTFPTNIANQDVTKNNQTFRKNLTNYCWEVGGGWILRQNGTNASGAQLALDVKGGWILNSGDLHFLSLSSFGVQLGIAKATSYLGIDATTGALTLNVGPGKAMLIMDPGTGLVLVSSLGGQPIGRVATVEGVVALVAAALTALGPMILPTPVTPAQVIAAMQAAIPLAGKTPPYALFAQLVNAALAVPRVPPAPDGSGGVPGLGAAGVMV